MTVAVCLLLYSLAVVVQIGLFALTTVAVLALGVLAVRLVRFVLRARARLVLAAVGDAVGTMCPWSLTGLNDHDQQGEDRCFGNLAPEYERQLSQNSDLGPLVQCGRSRTWLAPTVPIRVLHGWSPLAPSRRGGTARAWSA